MKKRKRILLCTITFFSTFLLHVNYVQAVSLPPRIAVETVKNYISIDNASLSVRGWAISPVGISKINVLVNGKLIGKAAYGSIRTDVKKVYPQYQNSGYSGYSYKLNLSNYQIKTYKLTVQAIGKDNRINSINRYFTVSSSIKSRLESITDNQNVTKGILPVNGWAISRYGIKSLKVMLDDKFIGYAAYGNVRSDVKAKYSEYLESEKSGFGYNLNLDNISEGQHKITVVVVDNLGCIQSIDRNITITERNSSDWGKMFLETPKGDITSSSVNLKGWFISNSGVNKVSIYLDNEYIGNAATGIVRNDVADAYTGYPQQYTSQSGFNYNLDINSIEPGVHGLKIIGTDNTERTLYLYKTINIVKKDPKLWVDAPLADNVINQNYVDVKGWALNASGVSNIQISLDGVYKGDATLGISRPDVDQEYSGYRDESTSGYLYRLDTSNLAAGVHTITIKAIGTDGTSSSKSLSFNMYGYVNYKYYPTTVSDFAAVQFSKGGNVTFSSYSTPATQTQIQYYLDPNNFINSVSGKYMFLKLSYYDGISVEDLNTVLKGKGVLEGMGQAYLDAGIANNVNPVYLVAHSLLETGNGTSVLSNGTLIVNGKNTYNVYGIGAIDSDPNGGGSLTAYNQGWFSLAAAIKGGAKFISANYINNTKVPQDTLYKMRWNYDNVYHQYATDVAWASKQVGNVKKLVDMMNNSFFYYEIPVYK